MSVEMRNRVVVRKASLEQVGAALTAALADELDWTPAPEDAPGSEDVVLRSAGEGTTLVALPWYVDAQEAVARKVSEQLSTEALAFSWCSDIPEDTPVAAFRAGRKQSVAKSGFAGIASAEELAAGCPSLEASGGDRALHLSFTRPLSDEERRLALALKEHVLPVLIQLGVAPEKLGAGYRQRGMTGFQFGRALGDGSRLVVICLWAGRRPEFELWRARDEAWSRLPLPELGETFDPRESEAQLQRYGQLLAAFFVRHARAALGELPGLSDTLARAEHSASWRTAESAFEALWRNRRVAHERAEEATRARVVFRGASLLLVETLGAQPQRYTLRFDSVGLPECPEVELSGFWERSGGATFARSLRLGEAVYAFNEETSLYSRTSAAGSP